MDMIQCEVTFPLRMRYMQVCIPLRLRPTRIYTSTNEVLLLRKSMYTATDDESRRRSLVKASPLGSHTHPRDVKRMSIHFAGDFFRPIPIRFLSYTLKRALHLV